jgi:imidazolonepropionase
MEVHDKAGSITRKKSANLFITERIPSIAYLPYSYGSNPVHKVMIRGKFI